jgi:hypothetical protein
LEGSDDASSLGVLGIASESAPEEAEIKTRKRLPIAVTFARIRPTEKPP